MCLSAHYSSILLRQAWELRRLRRLTQARPRSSVQSPPAPHLARQLLQRCWVFLSSTAERLLPEPPLLGLRAPAPLVSLRCLSVRQVLPVLSVAGSVPLLQVCPRRGPSLLGQHLQSADAWGPSYSQRVCGLGLPAKQRRLPALPAFVRLPTMMRRGGLRVKSLCCLWSCSGLLEIWPQCARGEAAR